MSGKKRPTDIELSTILEEEERNTEIKNSNYTNNNTNDKNYRIHTNGNPSNSRKCCTCKCKCGANNNNTSTPRASKLWRTIWTKRKNKETEADNNNNNSNSSDSSNKNSNSNSIQAKDKTKSLQWLSGWNFLLRSQEVRDPTVQHKPGERVSISVDRDMTDFGGRRVKSTEDEELLEKYKRMPRRGAICEVDERERVGLQRVLTHYVHLKSANRYGLI